MEPSSAILERLLHLHPREIDLSLERVERLMADLGHPELGSFSLQEMSSLRLPFGMGIERDILFTGDFPISVWAETARQAGSIRVAERILYQAAQSRHGDH